MIFLLETMCYMIAVGHGQGASTPLFGITHLEIDITRRNASASC